MQPQPLPQQPRLPGQPERLPGRAQMSAIRLCARYACGHAALRLPTAAWCSGCVCVCVSGCKLGEASDFLVQLDARVQVPTRTGPAGCYEVCSCGPSGRLENCVEMPCVDVIKPCMVGGQRKS